MPAHVKAVSARTVPGRSTLRHVLCTSPASVLIALALAAYLVLLIRIRRDGRSWPVLRVGRRARCRRPSRPRRQRCARGLRPSSVLGPHDRASGAHHRGARTPGVGAANSAPARCGRPRGRRPCRPRPPDPAVSLVDRAALHRAVLRRRPGTDPPDRVSAGDDPADVDPRQRAHPVPGRRLSAAAPTGRRRTDHRAATSPPGQVRHRRHLHVPRHPGRHHVDDDQHRPGTCLRGIP